MTYKNRPRGGNSPGPEDIGGGNQPDVVSMLPHRDDDPPGRRFGRPSSYSLTHAELAAEVRRRRREGWQPWEVRARFDFAQCA